MKFIFTFITLSLFALPALSQTISGTQKDNAAQPVEATADDLQVNAEENSAVFSGNARVVQGVLDLRADTITVFFEKGVKNIQKVKAAGKVHFTNGQETAESQKAQFDIASQIITFTGNVVLHQTQTVLTGNNLTYNVVSKRSKMSGNVKTVFAPN